MAAALVVGATLTGLVTAFRLTRSDWEVVVVEAAPAPPAHPVVPTGLGAEAAARLHLPSVAALRDKLDIRCGTTLSARELDRFGVTVTLSPGATEWFDLVIDIDTLFARFDDSLAIYAAELLGDAFDIFRDFADALTWWTSELREVT